MITGFFDQTNDFKDTLSKAKKYKLKQICLRKYDNKPILNLDNNDIKKINSSLKKENLTIDLIDSNIYLDFYSDSFKKAAYDNFSKIITITNKLNTNNIIIEIGEIINIVEELEKIKEILTPFIILAKTNNKTIILRTYELQKNAEIAYLLKQLNENCLKIEFNPKIILRNNEAPATVYRLFRQEIGAFIAQDENFDKTPELLGYGNTDMINLFKRLKRDKYKNAIIADHGFTYNDIDFKTYKSNIFMRVIKNEKKRNLERLETFKKRLFKDNSTEAITLSKIEENQIEVLRVVFR
mgnify:CR=1 FL=1